MCGIAGIILKPNHTLPDLRRRLQAMQDAMLHRGPDDGGVFIDAAERVGLVNRRLAIRDLSPAGHMPMCNPAQTAWITYNGEIYNADDLRGELEALGYHFRSTSDTEVILHGYEAWGQEIVGRLRGMFAFAIYNAHNSASETGEGAHVLLARDHMGIKPLYYAETDEAFIFASELKALLASGLVSRGVSATGLVGYLLTGSVPNPYTIYEDIRALQPAHTIQIRLPLTSAPRPAKYWELPSDTQHDITRLDDAEERVRELLAEAVRIRLVSDVPLGAFLSGGLDSSAVVALMRQAATGAIRTCSMVFEEAEYSEASYARAVADAMGTEHYERVITAQDVVSEFDNILHAMDQPSIDGVNTYFVSKTAREAGLTVALSGLGGDELFGGYPNTFGDVPRVMRALRMAQRVPAGAWLAHRAIQALPQRQRWSRIADALDRPASMASAYLTRRGLFSPSEVRQLVRPEVLEAVDPTFDIVAHVAERADCNTTSPADDFAWISRAELRTYTHHQLLRDTDVMSMIHALEVRVPLLDTRLVEAVLRLPRWTKVSSNGVPKPLLAKSVEGLLPDIVTQRRDKQGFTFPFDVWLRGPLRDNVSNLFDQAANTAWFQRPAIENLAGEFERRQLHWSRVWAVAALGAVM